MATSDSASVKHETVMDVTEEQIARVYAQAFLGAIGGSADPASQVEELESFVTDVLNRFPKLEQALKSSLVAGDQKEEILGRILSGRASKEVLNFLKVLSRHGRLNIVRSASRLAKKLFATQRGLIDVEVRVATAIGDDLRGEIENRMQQLLGAQPVLSVKVDPSLIAGMVIRVGDRVYDGSVKNQLERTRAKMIDRATEQIETRPDRFLVA